MMRTPNSQLQPRVALCQSGIIFGGRLRVILGMVRILNEVGIVPDILTSRLAISPADIAARYGESCEAKFRRLPRIPRLPHDFAIVLFNMMLNCFASGYDLLINTSNSIIFLPRRKKTITYMFFPRKRRIMTDAADIHQPETPLSSWSYRGLQRALLRLIYRFGVPHLNHQIVCLSEFTRAVLEEEYNIPRALPVVYPPVEIARFQGDHCHERQRAIVTVGRFAPNKRQLEQIKLAALLPDIPFHIVGFVGNTQYYEHCAQHVEEHGLANVHLHPNASFGEMLGLLQASKYFLHTLVNEPFGLTAVQASAAGCVPIVHDSGGQRETVPEPQLRYQNLKDVPAILDHLDSLSGASVEALRHRLQQHVAEHFDAKIFRVKMKAILATCLGLEWPDSEAHPGTA